jgi:hypothetical protein
MTDQRSRNAVEIGERWANQQATQQEIQEGRTASDWAVGDAYHAEYHAEADADFCITEDYSMASAAAEATNAARGCLKEDPTSRAASDYVHGQEASVPEMVQRAMLYVGPARAIHSFGQAQAVAELDQIDDAAVALEKENQAALARDLFGNPFRRIAFRDEWRTGTVLQLAQEIYRDRAFERMPHLAAALREAGCADHRCEHHSVFFLL